MIKKNKNQRRVGVWLIGAYGGISTCLIAGIEGIKRGLYTTAGLVTELPQFCNIGLVSLENIVFGGCDVREDTIAGSARRINKTSGLIGSEIIERIAPALSEIDSRISKGVVLNCGKAVEEFAAHSSLTDGIPTAAIIEDIQARLRSFRQSEALSDVVVVNVSSAEAFSKRLPEHESLAALRSCIEKDEKEKLSSGILYAYAAIDAGFPYVNFTSSISEEIPAIGELAEKRRVPHMGKDGKTGETLVKTVLAPMFKARNLKVLSWISHNILGNRDGAVLSNGDSAREKLRNKSEVLKKIIGDPEVDSQVRIDFVKSLDDWKTAWNFIHFTGFLDTRMIMQFIWQGCDSALAAPLVADLARLLEHAHRSGLSGPQRHLACFFKSPTGVDEQAFEKQFNRLMEYIDKDRKVDVTNCGITGAVRP